MIQKKAAFTLIELLVVIAIIAILAAILFPVFAQAKAAAKKTVCISNHKQMAMSTMMYTGDYDGQAPIGVGWNQGTNTVFFVHDLTEPYRKNLGVISCPSYAGSNGGQDYTGESNSGFGNSLFTFIRTRCPSCVPMRNFRYSAYTWNNGLFGIALDPSPFGLPRHWMPLNESSVPESASTIAYADGYLPKRYNTNESVGGWIDYWFKWDLWPRHTDGMALSFVDGHVKYYKFNGLPRGGAVQPGCANYVYYAQRPNYYDWKNRVPAIIRKNCGFSEYPKTEEQFECLPHPGIAPWFGDIHGVPGTCVADINDAGL